MLHVEAILSTALEEFMEPKTQEKTSKKGKYYDEEKIEFALSMVRIEPLTSNIARIAGDLRRLY